MKNQVLARSLAVLVAATLVMASSPGATRTSAEPESDLGPPDPLGVLRAPTQSSVDPIEQSGVSVHDELGWVVDVWKDSYTSGVSLSLSSAASHRDGDALLAALDIKNEVFDLLDRTAGLRVGDAWESETFDTSRYTALGLKVVGRGQVVCRTLWRWTPDEDFMADGPAVEVTSDNSPQTAFGDVLGMEAKILCEPTAAGPTTIRDLKLLFRR